MSEPRSISPASIRWPPNHSTATVERFRTTITTGKSAAIQRPTYSETSVSSSLATAKRARSNGSRTNARITRMPPSCSRITWLMRSSRFCARRNAGSVLATTNATAPASSGTATATSHDRPTSSRRAMTTPPTIMIGVITSIEKVMNSSVCTWSTSFVVRVISDGAPKAATSRLEKSPT